MLRDPGQRAAGRPHHGVEGRAVAANAVAAGEVRRIDGRPARVRRIEDLRLHRSADAIETYGSNICTTSSSPWRSASRLSAIVRPVTQSICAGSTPCRRRSCWRQSQGVGTSDTVPSFSRVRSVSRNAEGSRLPTRKNGSRAATSQKQTIGELGIVVARLHHAHRPAPRDVDRPVEQTLGRRGRRRRIEQFHLHALAGVESERVRGVEWRVEHRAKILRELDVHGHSGRDGDERLRRWDQSS